MNQQRPVETVEEFKLRIAAILRAKPEQISAPPRPHRLKRATNRKPKRQDPVSALQTGSNFSPPHFGRGSSHLGRSWTRKMLRVAAGKAVPRQRFLVNWVLYPLENRISLIAN